MGRFQRLACYQLHYPGNAKTFYFSIAKALSRMDEQDKKLLLSMAQGMARRGSKR
jgi:hypothetical protein